LRVLPPGAAKGGVHSNFSRDKSIFSQKFSSAAVFACPPLASLRGMAGGRNFLLPKSCH